MFGTVGVVFAPPGRAITVLLASCRLRVGTPLTLRPLPTGRGDTWQKRALSSSRSFPCRKDEGLSPIGCPPINAQSQDPGLFARIWSDRDSGEDSIVVIAVERPDARTMRRLFASGSE
jgi:hypothetical protein